MTSLQYLCSSSDKQLGTFCPRSLSTDAVELASAEKRSSNGPEAFPGCNIVETTKAEQQHQTGSLGTNDA